MNEVLSKVPEVLALSRYAATAALLVLMALCLKLLPQTPATPHAI